MKVERRARVRARIPRMSRYPNDRRRRSSGRNAQGRRPGGPCHARPPPHAHLVLPPSPARPPPHVG
eukprot:scaffold257270_cov21-Tisochrysis_lutea.AAC.1